MGGGGGGFSNRQFQTTANGFGLLFWGNSFSFFFTEFLLSDERRPARPRRTASRPPGGNPIAATFLLWGADRYWMQFFFFIEVSPVFNVFAFGPVRFDGLHQFLTRREGLLDSTEFAVGFDGLCHFLIVYLGFIEFAFELFFFL